MPEAESTPQPVARRRVRRGEKAARRIEAALAALEAKRAAEAAAELAAGVEPAAVAAVVDAPPEVEVDAPIETIVEPAEVAEAVTETAVEAPVEAIEEVAPEAEAKRVSRRQKRREDKTARRIEASLAAAADPEAEVGEPTGAALVAPIESAIAEPATETETDVVVEAEPAVATVEPAGELVTDDEASVASVPELTPTAGERRKARRAEKSAQRAAEEAARTEARAAELELEADAAGAPEAVVPEIDIDLTGTDVEEPVLSLVEQPVAEEPVAERVPEPGMNGNSNGAGARRRSRRESTKAPDPADTPEPVRLEVVRPEIVENEVVTPEVIDLTTDDYDDVARARPYLELLPSPAARLDDLPRDSGVEIVEEGESASQPTREMPERSRALRITTVKSRNGRRRWAFDFLVKRTRHRRQPQVAVSVRRPTGRPVSARETARRARGHGRATPRRVIA